MTRIWFNHWFSTAYNIINMIRADNPSFIFIGSNENEYSPIAAACDEWYMEPALKSEDYVDYCLFFCKEHCIDVFMPRREMLSISRRKKEFESIGTRVMVDDYSIISVLNHKDQAYSYMKAQGVTTIPEYHIVTSKEKFLEAYYDLVSRYREVCFKFVHDEGGKSFRLIDNNRKGYSSLFKKQNTRMTLDLVLEALSEKESFSPMMVMPNLSGNEVSVDCLNTNNGLIMLPREKDPTRIEKLIFTPEIESITREIYDAVHLEWPCNIQFKYLDGKPYFLEVNTRMSGGVQMACLASTVNIPSIAVNKILGVDKPWSIQKKDCFITHVEAPIVLENHLQITN